LATGTSSESLEEDSFFLFPLSLVFFTSTATAFLVSGTTAFLTEDELLESSDSTTAFLPVGTEVFLVTTAGLAVTAVLGVVTLTSSEELSSDDDSTFFAAVVGTFTLVAACFGGTVPVPFDAFAFAVSFCAFPEVEEDSSLEDFAGTFPDFFSTTGGTVFVGTSSELDDDSFFFVGVAIGAFLVTGVFKTGLSSEESDEELETFSLVLIL